MSARTLCLCILTIVAAPTSQINRVAYGFLGVWVREAAIMYFFGVGRQADLDRRCAGQKVGRGRWVGRWRGWAAKNAGQNRAPPGEKNITLPRRQLAWEGVGVPSGAPAT